MPIKRTRYIVLATCTLGLLGAGAAGVASAQTTHHRPQAVRHANPSLGAATNTVNASRGRYHPRPTKSVTSKPTASPSATPTSPAPTTVAPTTVAPTTTAPTTAPATTAPTTPPATKPPVTVAPTTAPTTAPPSGDAVLDQVLAHINSARTSSGLSAYTLSADLSKASAAHSALMVGGCGLSHQCAGEAGLGDRFTAAGVSWTSAGENIGQGNAGNNQAEIIAAANGLTDLMLAEVAPNDGHRKNLLNSGFKRIGLAVTRGADGRVWVTQDFVN
ncbi:CAP domain-containing protein [Winogradskya consettensis]|uniref:CAP domain-containing protein n=1 Tax=Winogradskya consettensis TaxID=113560 RepID=UPI001BB2F764|nr:CAP domain-containing protein [Actinoplanes consettensis]